MILLFFKECNKKFKNILEYYTSLINIPYIECPNCKSTNIIKWGTYNRNICFIDNSALVKNTIIIQRVKCKDCKTTHALIPSFIVPYKINTLDVILHTLSDNNNSFDISYDSFISWNKQFNKFLPFLKSMFNNISKYEIISKLKTNIFYYFKLFFDVNKKILMMSRPGIYDMTPF